MFRAALTVVVLTALLILAILVVSSLSAPSAKAPTNPPTPGPITPVTSPTAPTAAKTATSTQAKPTPSPTHKKTLGSRVDEDRRMALADRLPGPALLARAAGSAVSQVAVRRGGRIAAFADSGGPITARRLTVRQLPRGRNVILGPADSLVRPVWSADARFLLYVRVRPAVGGPGASWRLMEYDAVRHTTYRLADMQGLDLAPLGWYGRAPLFMVATTGDTSLYVLRGGLPHYLTVIAPQAITSAALSPSRPLVAFAAPTNCYNCTVNFLDVRSHDSWSGPTGFLDESELGWSRDGRSVVTVLHGRIAVVPAVPGAATRLGPASDLPLKWQHSLDLRVGKAGVRVRDTIDGSSVSGVYTAATAAL